MYIKNLVHAIAHNENPKLGEGCTPFIGAGLSAAAYPGLKDVVPRLAEAEQVPEWVPRKLPIVAEFPTVFHGDPPAPRSTVAGIIGEALSGKRVKNAWNALTLLAKLPFPLYITTNYDDLLERALVEVKREPIRLVSNWFPGGDRALFDKNFKEAMGVNELPRGKQAVVFHLHGWREVRESMVLTEEDYVDFLIAFARSRQQGVESARDAPLMIPPYVERAFASHKLLLVGYSMEDINFRVLLRAIRGLQVRNQTSSLSIQLAPRETTLCYQRMANAISAHLSRFDRIAQVNRDELLEIAGQAFDAAKSASTEDLTTDKVYLDRYFREQLRVNVIWKDAVGFIRDLYTAYQNEYPRRRS